MTVAFDSDVTLRLDFGFGASGVYALPSQTTTDVSAYLREFTLSFGRGIGATTQPNTGTLVLTLDNNDSRFTPTNGSSPYNPNVKLNKTVKLTATYNSTDYPLFFGHVSSWTVAYPNQKDCVARVEVQDFMRVLNDTRISTVWNEGSSDSVIDEILTSASLHASLRNLETGTVDIQQYDPQNTSALALIRQVTDTEGGLFYFDPSGDARFHNRNFRLGTSSVATFGDSGTDLRYVHAEFSLDDANIWNQIVVDRLVQDGEIVGQANYPAASATVNQVASQVKYGIKTLALSSTLHADIEDVFTHASDMAALWSSATFDVKTLNVDPKRAEETTTGAWASVLGLDLGQKITVNQTPDTGSAISRTVFVEAVTHSANARMRTWDTTIGTSAITVDLLTPSGSLEPTGLLTPE